MVIYDSVFGNTEKVAKEMGKALGTKKQAKVFKVDAVDLEQLKGVKVLIVGSPTRAFSPTPATTAFLKRIPANSLKGVKVAAFDTDLAGICRAFAYQDQQSADAGKAGG